MQREQLLLIDLPAELVQHIVVRIQLAHHIARAAPTCKVVSVAARNAIKVRGFSTEVVTLGGHRCPVMCVATRQHREALQRQRRHCPAPFTHHAYPVQCLALLPDGLRFVSGSHDGTARIAYHGLAL